MRAVSAAFPALCAVSLGLPFGVGWAIGGWHDMHHSDPACARHGADPRQVDISAIVIRIFEHLGWATGVHWPVPARLDRRRRDQGRPQAAPVLQDSEALIPPAPG